MTVLSVQSVKKILYEEFGVFQSLLQVKCRDPLGVSIALAYDEIRVIFNRFESNIKMNLSVFLGHKCRHKFVYIIEITYIELSEQILDITIVLIN